MVGSGSSSVTNCFEVPIELLTYDTDYTRTQPHARRRDNHHASEWQRLNPRNKPLVGRSCQQTTTNFFILIVILLVLSHPTPLTPPRCTVHTSSFTYHADQGGMFNYRLTLAFGSAVTHVTLSDPPTRGGGGIGGGGGGVGAGLALGVGAGEGEGAGSVGGLRRGGLGVAESLLRACWTCLCEWPSQPDVCTNAL